MKQILDFIPLIVFFVLYKMYDIYVATAALIVVTLLQVFLTWVLYKKIEKMQLVTAIMVAIFGGMTLFFQDDNFIKWKVTIVYLVFAVGLFVSDKLNKPLIKGMLGKEVSMHDLHWRKVNNAWVGFFLALAVGNIYVAYQMPLDVWVNFKVFGLLIITLVFTVSTGLYIYKHASSTEDNIEK